MTQSIKEQCEQYVREHNIPGEYAAYDLERFVQGMLDDNSAVSELLAIIRRIERHCEEAQDIFEYD